MRINLKKFIITILICIISCITFVGCSFSNSDTKPEKDESSNIVAEVNVSETATYNNISWKINEYKNSTTIPTKMDTNITTTENFIRIELIVSNFTTTEFNPDLSDIKLKMKEPLAIYTPKDYVYAYNRMGTKKVGSQMSVNYFINFETPYETSEKDFVLQIVVGGNMFSGYKLILINL
jgi:hypothetical protein